MAHNSLVPKQRTLTENETQASFEGWKESMIFHISLDNKSSRFLSDLKSWTTAEDRGFTNDAEEHDAASKMNSAAKAALLNIVLGSVASYAPVISHRFVKQQATSFEVIWDRLRAYYGLRKTGARVLELMEFRLEQNESREALWERLYSYMEDNLLTRNGGVKHEGVKPEANEEFTPTLLNVLVTCWLNIINPSLPSLVRQRFSTQLRGDTVFTLREEISDVIPTLLAEMEDREINISRAGAYQKGNYQRGRYSRNRSFNPSKRSCCLCEAAGRPSVSHYLSACPFLPSDDKRYLSKAREVVMSLEDIEHSDEDAGSSQKFSDSSYSRISMISSIKPDTSTEASLSKILSACSRRVAIVASPVLEVSVNSKASNWTLDSGAEANLITIAECRRLGVESIPASQRAVLADGDSLLPVIGEVHFTATRGHHSLKFGGLVVQKLASPVLAGMPFHLQNDVSIQYSTSTIFLGSCCSIKYNPVKMLNPVAALKIASQTCILPGDQVSFHLPDAFRKDCPVAIEPRITVPHNMPAWVECKIVLPDLDGCVSIRNTTPEPVLLSKHTQVCQVRPTTEVPVGTEINPGTLSTIAWKTNRPSDDGCSMLNTIKVDPSNILAKADRVKFHQIHKKYESVFSAGVGCYNGYSGKFTHVINVGSKLPPQRKGRIPVYNRADMERLQEKFDELLEGGVLARAEDIDVAVEYVHPSFLIKKTSGGHRLVTSFGEVAEYARPQPTVTSNVEHVLHQVGQWKYIVKADLKSAYYQIPLSPESSKYVGVMTPYRGTFVYLRSVMGLPGSEAALEEVLSRIFGDMIREGKMVKLADDLYVGASTMEQLTVAWEEILQRLLQNGLKLSPDKTVCCPTSTNILGWQWEKGTLRPSSHRVNALAACETPSTVKGLRSFIGSYKFLSRVLPCYAEVLHPLEEACGGKQSAEKLVWSEELNTAFNMSKDHLRKAKPVILPRYDDQLHIVTDAAANCSGLAATLYVIREGKPALAGYFNAVLRKNQGKLLPCELEALAIAGSIKHYSYYITQSHKRTRILTDSRPCVLAYRKLMRGEFSASPKVTTFLSLASRYGVEIMHIAGINNQFADFASRNPVECNTKNCEICKFIQDTCSSSIGEVKISDILSGESKVPFASRTSWIGVQQACPDLNKVYKSLSTGATIPKKRRQLTDVRRYLSCGVSVATGQHHKLLVIRQSTAFKPTVDRIVIPREVSGGLLTALHIQLNHPSAHQLKLVFCRAFFCLDLDAYAKKVVESCYTCAALKNMPASYHEQSTSPPAEIVGSKYSADVVRRYGQFIMLIREDISSFTDAVLIDNEKADTLRDGIILLTSRLRSQLGPKAVVRTDPASGLRSLVKDRYLSQYNLSIELGEPKNINKNPIAEKGIEELHAEIIRLKPLGGKIDSTLLARAVSNLNSRVRHNKLSAAEIWTQRDMTTGSQLSIDDKKLINLKQTQRLSQHKSSAKYKARGKEKSQLPTVAVGDIVYLYSDRSKLKSRNKYIITKVQEELAVVQKFTNSQFRGREYRVKKSDIITVPKDSPVHLGKHQPESEEEDNFVEDVSICLPRTQGQHQQMPQQQAAVNENVQPRNVGPANLEMQTDTLPEVFPKGAPAKRFDRSHVDAIKDARPVRERRPPSYLEDYLQDLSGLSDEEDRDDEVRRSVRLKGKQKN